MLPRWPPDATPEWRICTVAATISVSTGRQVRTETISQEALRSSLRSAGLGDKQVEGVAGMSAVMRGYFAAED